MAASASENVSDKIQRLQKEIDSLDTQRGAKAQELAKAISGLPEDPNLVFYYGDGCGFTKRAEPSVNCVEAALGKRLKRLEVWHNSENRASYKSVGGEANCGGVPFFYNGLTKAVICGVTDCESMKKWAK